MHLFIDEQEAISVWLVALDQSEFETFLARTGVVTLATFSSNTRNMPIIAVDFNGWLDKNPEKVPPILKILIAEYPVHPSAGLLKGALKRIQQAIDTSRISYPWQAVLPNGVPVVNRTQLRRTLEGLVSGIGYYNNSGVILIHGHNKTGKSHSWYLISHVARQCRIPYLKIDLKGIPPELNTIDTIFDQLTRKLNLQNINTPTKVGVTPVTLAERYVEELVVAWSILPAGVIYPWIVFDGLGQGEAPEARRFISALVERRLDHQLGPCCIFLLGAGQDYGIDDPFDRIHYEALSGFLRSEVEHAARELNQLGQVPLCQVALDARIKELCQTLETSPVPCKGVSDMLVVLRKEIRA